MAEGKIYAAICGVMEDVGAVKKTDRNEFDKYMYRGIDAVMNALQPAMIKHHIFVIPEVIDQKREDRVSKKGDPMIYSVTTVKYRFTADDGSYVTAVVIGEAMDRGDKSMNKAMSAAFKYACFQTFCIPTEEMIDSEKDSPQPEAVHTVAHQTPEELGEKLLKRPTEKQLNYMNKMWKSASDEEKAAVREKFPNFDDLTMEQASEIIEMLKK